MLRVNIVEYVQDESKQAIMKQEDARLLTVMETALTDYGTNADHTVTAGAHQINELAGYITPDSLYDLVGLIDSHELTSARILMNPRDFRDILTADDRRSLGSVKQPHLGPEHGAEKAWSPTRPPNHTCRRKATEQRLQQDPGSTHGPSHGHPFFGLWPTPRGVRVPVLRLRQAVSLPSAGSFSTGSGDTSTDSTICMGGPTSWAALRAARKAATAAVSMSSLGSEPTRS